MTKIDELYISLLARKTVISYLVCYLTSLNDEAISKSQSGFFPRNGPDDTPMILAQVSISNTVC